MNVLDESQDTRIRADFEAWYEKQMRESPRIAEDMYTPFATACWEAYQAGRAALQSQDREDAERYRWLLDRCYRWPPGGRVCNEDDQSEAVAIWTKRRVGDDPCKAIDHARRNEGKGNE